MTTKFNDTSVKIEGRAIIQAEAPSPVPNPEIASAYTIFFPESRYPGGVGGQTWRIVQRNGSANGKPTYGYGDEIIMWSATSSRWEMNNAYQGTISYSPENVAYPWNVVHWYYGANVPALDVYVNAIAP